MTKLEREAKLALEVEVSEVEVSEVEKNYLAYLESKKVDLKVKTADLGFTKNKGYAMAVKTSPMYQKARIASVKNGTALKEVAVFVFGESVKSDFYRLPSGKKTISIKPELLEKFPKSAIIALTERNKEVENLYAAADKSFAESIKK